jgi:NAD(P)H-hydrate epimerase
MEVLTGEQMRRADRRAIDDLGIPSLDLMERAGRGVCEALIEDYPDAAGLGVLVLCGKGNNGGDGLAAARHLAHRGAAPRVILLARADALSPDAAQQLRRAREAGLDVREAPDAPAWERERAGLERAGLVLDALLGTGIHGGAQGLLAAVIEEVNRAGRHVVSIDLPSGLDADRGAVGGPAERAERTYTLCRPNPAQSPSRPSPPSTRRRAGSTPPRWPRSSGLAPRRATRGPTGTSWPSPAPPTGAARRRCSRAAPCAPAWA